LTAIVHLFEDLTDLVVRPRSPKANSISV